MAGKKINLDTMSQTNKKKKDFIIIGSIIGIFALFGLSIFSFSLDVDERKIYNKRSMDALKNSELKITPKENIKEAWAISVENTFKEQNKFFKQFKIDMDTKTEENQREILKEMSDSQIENDKKLFSLNKKLEVGLDNIRKEMKESMLKQDNRIEELKLSNKSGINLNLSDSDIDEDIVLGDDLLPKLQPKKDDKNPFLDILNGIDGKDGKNGKNILGKDGKNILGKDGLPILGKDGLPILGKDGLTGTDGIDGIDGQTKDPIETIFNIDNLKNELDYNDLIYKIKKDDSGKNIIIDKDGNPLDVKIDENNIPIVDDNGNNLFISENGDTLKITEDINGKKMIINEDTKKRLRMRINPKGEPIFIDKVDGEKKSEEKEKKKVSLFSIDTKSVKKYRLREKERELAEIRKRLKEKNTYHIMTGLTKAYLVTGVYAPAFSEGKSDPLPVLLQAEGNILIANNDTESIENCFLLGSAKGNMNSETADIRLNKISCSLADGTKKIEGSISGWVIGENGIPGVPGELLHKNGAWLAKTFVAGFLDTFSQTLVSYAGAGGKNGNASNGTITVGDSLASAGAQSTSDVFQKIGDYYLKMAEQIFPVIEVKPGRTVDILLKGGDTLTITDFNSAEIDQIETDIVELKRQQKEDEERLIELKISKKNVLGKKDFSVKKKTSTDKIKKINLFN